MQSLMSRRRGKGPSRDRGSGADRSTRASAARSLDNSMDTMEGIIMGGDSKGGIGGEKHMAHKEWTKESFPDDFDDSDLE